MIQRFEVPCADQLAAFKPAQPLLWKDYAEWWLTFPLGRMLDFGCGRGEFLARVADRCSVRCGVDVDPDHAMAARRESGAQVAVVGASVSLPFADESFHTVVILEVIEHVADEAAVLRELGRVLAPGGRLLLTTPHQGLLTFLDPGNFKFIAPRVHRFIHCTVLRRKEYYRARFGDSRRDHRGMVADFTLDQSPWHRHYRPGEIQALAPRDLATVGWSVYYPAFRALWSLRLVLKVASLGLAKQLPGPLRWLDRRLSRCECRWGDQLVMLFEKEKRNA